jgi:quinoprotein glucose dehydrogenase
MHSIWDYFGRSRFNYSMVVGLVVLGLSGVGAAADGLSAAAVAVAGFTLPEGMTMTAVAADPLVANPVAFCLDEQGRIYVCETFRQSKGVEDNRKHGDWLETDLSLTTVSERVAMFRKFLGDKAAAYTEHEDRIRLLTDTDGDGLLDEAADFADGFRGIEEGTGAGVLAVDGDVYYTCIPRLWRLRDDDGDGVAERREALHDGYGVRVAFRGHDMHGLALGPDGRIYFSIGDRGYNVLTPEGSRLVRPETGAVFRCERDGSGLEEFAYGLRNPQELAFDDFGNLFTGDNNSDSGDKARWVHVVEGGDTGWRMHYQYLPDRGPWNRERIWYPYRVDEATAAVQPAAIVPPVANLGDGPSGLVAYPGVGLPQRYNGHFFLADFRGSKVNSGIRTFAVKPKGASFELVDSDWFIKGVLATDVDFGYDGRLYLSDWIEGWNGIGAGRIYVGEMAEAAASAEVAALFREGFAQRSPAELERLLGHADRRVRQRAQFALVEQNQAGRLERVAAEAAGPLRPRLHAVWGLGQLLRKNAIEAGSLLMLLNDPDSEVRRQAATVLGDARRGEALSQLFGLLGPDHSAAEQAAAAIAIARIAAVVAPAEIASAVPALIAMLARNDDADAVLRHAGCYGLAAAASTPDLVSLADDPRPAVRLAAVVALGRQQAEGLTAFLDDADGRVVTAAVRAIHDESDGGELPALAALACRDDLTDAARRRAMNAAFRLGGHEQAERVAKLAADGRLAEALRLEAIEELRLWAEPPVLDRVTNRYRPLAARPAAEAAAAVAAHFAEILDGPDAVREQAVALLEKYDVAVAVDPLLAILDSGAEPPALRAAAVKAVGSLKQEAVANRMRTLLRDQDPTVRSAARGLLGNIDPALAVVELAAVLRDASVGEQQAAIESLVALKSVPADEVLVAALTRQAAGTGSPAILLDLFEAADVRGTPQLLEAVKVIEATDDPDDRLAGWRQCLAGGDVAAGRKIFHENTTASCLRCHQVNGKGGEVGPNLSEVGKQKPAEYLLESIVAPNAVIAKGFGTVQFLLADGTLKAGIVREETTDAFRIITPEAKELVIAKDDIDETSAGLSGMPADIAKQLSKRQIRDLVTYLGSLQKEQKPTGHDK